MFVISCTNLMNLKKHSKYEVYTLSWGAMWIYSIITRVWKLRKGDKPEQNEGKERVVRYEKYYFLQETELTCPNKSHQDDGVSWDAVHLETCKTCGCFIAHCSQITVMLSQCIIVCAEKLIVPELVKEFLAFCGTWRFVTMFTMAFHLSLSWTISVQSMPSYPVSLRSASVWSSYFTVKMLHILFNDILYL